MSVQTVTAVRLSWRDPQTVAMRTERFQLPLTIGRLGFDNTVSLDSRLVSKRHAKLSHQNGMVVVTDLGSRNGTALGERLIDIPTAVPHGASIQIGAFRFCIEYLDDEPEEDDEEDDNIPLARHDTPAVDRRGPDTDPIMPSVAGTMLESLFEKKIVELARLEALTTVESLPYVTIGGGLGSFIWANYLTISGVSPTNIRSIGFDLEPYGRYRQLCRQSQIPDHERLRSNTDSCPDNIWGWPGYGLREIGRDFVSGRWGNALRVGWQLVNEPFVQTYTPRAGNVFASIDREAARIGWSQIHRVGRVQAIRSTDDGRYAILFTPIDHEVALPQRVVIGRYVHIAVGYPGVRFLPDLQAYRRQTGDTRHVINAYEDHNHVYESLQKDGGLVLIRGRGIVASRIIQRLVEIRDEFGVSIQIIHLMRTPNEEGNRFRWTQRQVSHHWEMQPFNWPKAAWGGPLQRELEEAGTATREQLMAMWGGTTTADRVDWREMIDTGVREGWYEIAFGDLESISTMADEDGRIVTRIEHKRDIARKTEFVADYVVDATGLDAGVERHALLKDLIHCYDLPRNQRGQLAVTPSFEIEGMRTPSGRMFASGIATLGGHFAPVDSFLGLQFAALRTIDAMAAVRAPDLRALNGWRSFGQWTRWAIGVQP